MAMHYVVRQGVSVKSCSYYYGGILFKNKSTSSGHVICVNYYYLFFWPYSNTLKTPQKQLVVVTFVSILTFVLWSLTAIM